MEATQLSGVWTAIITPFLESGQIDYSSLNNLLDRQIVAGVTGVLVCGTTGESPALSIIERSEILSHVVSYVGGQILVMMGTGTNSTASSIENTRQAQAGGADVVLVVNPYYNKPTQTGLYQHFEAIAQSTDLPVVLYNIKSRTGVNLETDTLLELVRSNPNIMGVKEASGDIDQIIDVCKRRPRGFVVLSGDDSLTFEVMRWGGADGVISVASNIVPSEINSMVQDALQENWSQAFALNNNLQRLFSDIFVETNPMPTKYILSRMGLCSNNFRLPMCPINEESESVLRESINNYNLI
jgi:4-hydroxy-tetrahydrodipicolinate synthase